jgi:hypothetical protein
MKKPERLTLNGTALDLDGQPWGELMKIAGPGGVGSIWELNHPGGTVYKGEKREALAVAAQLVAEAEREGS